jgi:hypothetical protein
MLVATDDRGFKLAVALAMTLPSVAHQVCPYSNATRGNIDVSLSVNGRDIEPTSEGWLRSDFASGAENTALNDLRAKRWGRKTAGEARAGANVPFVGL